MRNSKAIMPILFFSMLLSMSCKKDVSTNEMMMMEEAKIQSYGISPKVKEKLHQLRSSMPAGYEKRLEKITQLSTQVHPWFQQTGSLLNASPAPCEVLGEPNKIWWMGILANTQLWRWINEQLSDWDEDLIYFLLVSGISIFPFYDAGYFETSPENFGLNGEFTQSNKKVLKDLKRFWDIQSDDILIVPYKGSMLRDREKLIRADKLIYDDDQATAEYWADLILMMLAEVPQFRNGDHPVFTFNGGFSTGTNHPEYGVIPAKIIMGDGFMEAFFSIGLEDVAVQSVAAHEFGHLIQVRKGLFFGTRSPERNRRIELMADALSAYYMSHARGASMQWKRVQEFLQVVFVTGDCAFNENYHHGTPTQRMAAAEWAYQIADQSKVQGHILTSAEFIALFEASLPAIVAH